MKSTQLGRIMRMSWEIQKKRRGYSRAKSLISAWAIFQNEDVTVFHLVKKHSHDRYPNKTDVNTIALF